MEQKMDYYSKLVKLRDRLRKEYPTLRIDVEMFDIAHKYVLVSDDGVNKWFHDHEVQSYETIKRSIENIYEERLRIDRSKNGGLI